MFYVANLASLAPKSIWPGTEGKRKVPTRSEATVGEFERYPVGVPGVWLLCHPVQPIFQDAIQPK